MHPVARRERAARNPLLDSHEIEDIRARANGDPDVAKLLAHAETLQARLGLGPLTAIDTDTHYLVEITVRQNTGQ